MDVSLYDTAIGVSIEQEDSMYNIPIEKLKSMVALYQFTEHGIMIMNANHAYFDYFNCKRYEIIDSILYNDFTSLNQRFFMIQRLYEHARYKESIHEVVLVEPKDHPRKWIQFDSSIIDDYHGNPVYFTIHTDVTPIKEMLTTLESEHELYIHAIETAHDSIFEYDIQLDALRIFFAVPNNSVTSAKELMIKNFKTSDPIDQKLHPEDSKQIVDIICNGQNKVYDFRCDAYEPGNYEWFQMRGCSTIHSKDGTAIRIVGTFRNIEHIKLMELKNHEMQVTESILRSVIKRIISDDYDYLTYWDTVTDNYFMFTHENITTPLPPLSGTHYSEEILRYANQYVTEADRLSTIEGIKTEKIIAELDNNEEYTLYNSICENGSIAYKQLRFVYLNKEKKIVFLTRSDITKIREAEFQSKAVLEKALSEAEKASYAKTSFLSRISHDIRTPMNAIIGMSTIASYKCNDPERVKYCLDRINEASRYLLTLINDILDMSKIESGKLQLRKSSFNMQQFISNIEIIVGQQAFDYGVGFSVDVDDSAGSVYIGDPLRINQILINLLSNALNFTSAEGHVSFGIRELKRENSAALLEFIVQDNGCGMSKEFQEIMYNPFEQESSSNARNQVGTGLGLSIVMNLVKLMGGDINAESELGVGTKFTITIPLLLPTKQEAEALNSSFSMWNETDHELETIDNYDFNGQSVLLVEDNEINLEIAEIFLQDIGFKVERAYNGQEAVDLFYQAKPYHFSAILMDIRMPLLDGLAATKTIRTSIHEDAKTIPIIAMSANAFDEDRKLARQAGMNGYLVKPINMKRLIQMLNYSIIPK